MKDERKLERERLAVVLTMVFINVIAVALLTFAPWSDCGTGLALNIIDNLLLLGFVIIRCVRLLAKFLLVGAGILGGAAILVCYAASLTTKLQLWSLVSVDA